MIDSRRVSISRVRKHLAGWRWWAMVGSALPLVIALVMVTTNPWTGLVLAILTLLPVLTVVLVLAIDTSRSADQLTRIIGPSKRIQIDLESLNQRVDVIDSVVSSETRRPWEPTTRPFHHVSGADPKPILLLPGADYHLTEIVAIADELDSRSIRNVIAVGRPHWDRTGDGLVWYDREVFEAPPPEEIPGNFSALLTMKDWAGYRPLVEAANEAGVPTFAKVEGAQDFNDVDTNQPRHPYRTARHILCQGQNDYDALDGMERTIVGSTRLERLWWAPPANPTRPLAVINLNFTYGVLTDARDLWLQTAIEGCEMARIPYLISVHPAERARTPHPKATSISASRLLRQATVLVSRFSTLPFEAMARGVPFIYHNPHEESVSCFKDSSNTFPTTTDAQNLLQAFSAVPQPGTATRKASVAFFTEQVAIDNKRRSETRAVEVISSRTPAGR